MGRFKLGFSLGTILGAGLLWLNATEKGRKKRDALLDHAAAVYAQVKERVRASDAWKQMSQSDYAAMVKEVVDKYAVQTGLAEEVKRLVEKLVRTQWKNLREQMSATD